MSVITFFSLSLFSYFFLHAYRKVLSWVNSVEAVSSMSIKLLLLFYQIRYSRENKRHSWILEIQNNKCQMERMTELERFIAPLRFLNYAKIRVSRQIHLHRVTTIWFISSENLHALDLNTLEQRTSRQVFLDVM